MHLLSCTATHTSYIVQPVTKRLNGVSSAGEGCAAVRSLSAHSSRAGFSLPASQLFSDRQCDLTDIRKIQASERKMSVAEFAPGAFCAGRADEVGEMPFSYGIFAQRSGT